MDAITSKDGVNLRNLQLLNTTMSLNDLADAIEALHVRASWQHAESRKAKAQAARERIVRALQKRRRR